MTRRKAEHQTRNSAEEHADSDEYRDHEFGTGRPRFPNHQGKDQGEYPVKEQPAPRASRLNLQCQDNLQHPFEEQVGRNGAA